MSLCGGNYHQAKDREGGHEKSIVAPRLRYMACEQGMDGSLRAASGALEPCERQKQAAWKEMCGRVNESVQGHYGGSCKQNGKVYDAAVWFQSIDSIRKGVLMSPSTMLRIIQSCALSEHFSAPFRSPLS